MFSRSRTKIILSIMLSLILLLVVTLSVIMLASYREIRQRDSEMLERFAAQYTLPVERGNAKAAEGESAAPDKPGSEAKDLTMPGSKPEDQDKAGLEPENLDKPGSGPEDQKKPGSGPNPINPPPDERRDYELSTFYSVVLSTDGTVLNVNSGEKGLYEEDELVGIARDLLSENKSSGSMGNLSYKISEKDGYTLAAFLDNTVLEKNMKMLLRNVLIVGGAAIVALFFLSLFLSRMIIRPLEENDKLQKQFISDAGHELKTPVAVIAANAELLSREIGENEWLSNIRYENERMGDLVQQLLCLSRVENQEEKAELLDLSRIVTGEVLAFESLAFDRGKTFKSDIAEGIQVAGSRTSLTQLVSILLDNAVSYAAGSEIEVTLKSRGHTALLCVANDGDEIPPEKLSHLFDRFYRVDEARSGEDRHYGLGLSIAKAAAEKNGGEIGVSCRDGRIVFSVSLPVKA